MLAVQCVRGEVFKSVSCECDEVTENERVYDGLDVS
jgi:hypothetical protein